MEHYFLFHKPGITVKVIGMDCGTK